MSESAMVVPRVFVSHSWLNKPLARRVARRLRHAGAEVLFDETDFEPGQELTGKIREQIRRSTHLVVIWTEAAAASDWVKRELEYAAGVEPPRPVIVPLLVIPPGQDGIVADRVGVQYYTPYRFEHSLEPLLKSIFGNQWARGTSAQLVDDLIAVLGEAPRVARLLQNPVEEQRKRLHEVRGDDVDLGGAFRKESLAVLTEVFDAWRRASVSVIALPTSRDSDYHTIDFALWCSVLVVLDKRAQLKPLLPIELRTYPPIFARVFGTTQAGFEALLALLDEYPGLAPEALVELTAVERVADDSVVGVVELFRAVFNLSQPTSERVQVAPFEAASMFFRHNRHRLTLAQKEVFFGLVETHGNGPYPGGPLDLLGELSVDADFTPVVTERLQFWVESGLFDGVHRVRRAESPALFHGFVAGMLRRGLRNEGELLIGVASARITKLFRSTRPDALVSALIWIADTDRLPLAERGFVQRAYEEGVYSAEFERGDHADTVRGLAGLLVQSATREEHVDTMVRQDVRRQLMENGFPDRFPD